MKMKKITAMSMAALMAATMIPSVPVMADGGGKVYYLNFKPEQDEAWQNLAKAYTEETGTDVTVVTAASGQYETTLQSEMAKSDAPTLFQVNGPVGLKNWKDYCYDLKDAFLFTHQQFSVPVARPSFSSSTPKQIGIIASSSSLYVLASSAYSQEPF